jgi:hypothetical protein
MLRRDWMRCKEMLRADGGSGGRLQTATRLGLGADVAWGGASMGCGPG